MYDEEEKLSHAGDHMVAVAQWLKAHKLLDEDSDFMKDVGFNVEEVLWALDQKNFGLLKLLEVK